MTKNKIVSFTSIGTIIATISSAVGLGNIWKFPTMVGMNGGAGFILIYLLSSIFIALPIMIAEFYLGQKTKSDAVSSIEKIAPNNKWRYVGYLGLFASLLLTTFYTCVIGWLVAYFVKSLAGNVVTADITLASENFNNVISSPLNTLGFQWFVYIAVSLVLILGIKKGTERLVKIFLPLLVFLLLILTVNSLTLDKAGEGLRFLFDIRSFKFSSNIIILAMGLAFFKLSIGSAIMQTYASYFPEKVSLPNVALKVALADLLISIIAGIVIFPTVFTYGLEPSVGAGLLFITIPVAFSGIIGGNIFVSIFFLLSILAAFGSILSIFEGTITYLEKYQNFSRKKAVATSIIFSAALGSLCSLSMTPVLENIKIFSLNFFDLFDYISSNICMPITGFFIALLVGRFINGKELKQYILDTGAKNKIIVEFWYLILRYITPILVILVFLSSLGIF